MRIGIVASAGGAAFTKAVELLSLVGINHEFHVVTDRPCDMENRCKELGLNWKRVAQYDNREFSTETAGWLFEKNQVDWVCFFLSRLVTKEIFDRGTCVNIHPSLLPSFPGMGAVRRAWESGVSFIGASAHYVDQSIDGGKLIGQVIAPLDGSRGLQEVNHLSFAQKVYLMLLLTELSMQGVITRGIDVRDSYDKMVYTNPSLQNDDLLNAFKSFLLKNEIKWTI